MNYLVLRRAVMRYYMPLGSPPSSLSYNMQALDIHDLLLPNKLVPWQKICLRRENGRRERIDLISENGGGD